MQELVGESLLVRNTNAQITLCAFTDLGPCSFTGICMCRMSKLCRQISCWGRKKYFECLLFGMGASSIETFSEALLFSVTMTAGVNDTFDAHASPVFDISVQASASEYARSWSPCLDSATSNALLNSALLTDVKRTTGSNASPSSQPCPTPAGPRHAVPK